MQGTQRGHKNAASVCWLCSHLSFYKIKSLWCCMRILLRKVWLQVVQILTVDGSVNISLSVVSCRTFTNNSYSVHLLVTCI
jgi:hypothetical protein